jgi:CheY-like chemotaxis protein/signal transduction histidine kinase
MGDWRSTEAARRRVFGRAGRGEALVRLGYSLFVAVAAALALKSLLWPALWFGAAISLHVTVMTLSAPLRRDPTVPLSPTRRRAHATGVFLVAMAFAGTAPVFWFAGGWGSRLFALVMLAEAAMHIIGRWSQAPKLMWICLAPILGLLQLLPILTFVTAPPDLRGMRGVIALAAALLVARFTAGAAARIATARRLRLALEEAQRERLRAEAASAAKSEFLDLMGHELKTPLNGVLGMAQAMSGADLPPEQRRQLEVIRASGELLLLFVNDVLDFSRISAAEMELNCGVVEPRALASETKAAFALIAEARGLSLQVAWLPGAGEQRAGDPQRVRQLMRSVAGLALKWAQPGLVSIVVGGDADELRIEVAGLFSCGSPMLAEAELDATAERHGSRLVLGMARDLARRMGGDIAVNRGLDDEDRLVVRLALPLQTGALGVAGEVAAGPLPVVDTRLRVLAADDNPTNQLVLKTLLEQAGLAVHIVADGQEAVDAWRSAPWDVVLMDIRMPRLDGVAAARAIREMERAEGRPRTPILAVTADAMSHQSEQYVAAGMDGVVAKPIQFAELAAVVAAAALRCAEDDEARLHAGTSA